MKIKDLLIPLLLAVFTTGIIHYFFLKRPGGAEIVEGQEFIAPSSSETHKPITTEVLFAQEKPQEAQRTMVKTTYGIATFTTRGGGLERLDFVRTRDGHVETITPLNAEQAPYAAFLVAFAADTPSAYQLAEVDTQEDRTRLVYHVVHTSGEVRKEFVVSHAVPKIELHLSFVPTKNAAPSTLRLLVPVPYVAATDLESTLTVLYYSDGNLKQDPINLEVNKYWRKLTLFGAEDKYFVHALCGDIGGFAQRAYFGGEKFDQAHMFFESATLTEAKNWQLTFYCGPKDVAMMSAVDARLEQTMQYGWLALLVKLLMLILQWLYQLFKNYGYAILALTFLIRLIMVPFTLKGNKAMERQKEFQQKMRYIEHRYKDDPERLQLERIELTKKLGSSGFMGCLPQLVQLPILFALNRLLSTSYDLYQAPFAGWIMDLSARDPYYVLPLLAGAGILFQTTESTDMRGGMMMMLFAAVIVAVTANLSAGVTLYLCCNTWLSILQTRIQKAYRL